MKDGMAKARGSKKQTKARKPGAPEKPGASARKAAQAAAGPSFPVVALGASAGGLEAFEKFFRHMPHESGMAFVLVPHLDAHHKSAMSELVQRHTAMKVVEITDGMV